MALPLFTAHRMASGMLIGQRRSSSASTISSSDTGRRVEQSARQHRSRRCGTERPRSPCRTPPQPEQVALPQIGWSRPSLAQSRHVLGRRLIAQHGIGEIARQQRGDQEGQQRDGEQDRQQIEQAAGR